MEIDENTQGPWNPWLTWFELERAAMPRSVLLRHVGDTWVVQIEDMGCIYLADNALTPTEAMTKVLAHVRRNQEYGFKRTAPERAREAPQGHHRSQEAAQKL